jgi:hypothetical protein
MRSAGEPGSREEDTIEVRCRDTWFEGGGYEARLSNDINMNSIEPVDNMTGDMSAMQSMQRLKKECGPARGESGATSDAGTNSRKEGTQQEQGRRRSARCAEADIGCTLLPNNRASDMEAMRMMHAIWNKRFESMGGGSFWRFLLERHTRWPTAATLRMPQTCWQETRAWCCRRPGPRHRCARYREGRSLDRTAAGSAHSNNWPRDTRKRCS